MPPSKPGSPSWSVAWARTPPIPPNHRRLTGLAGPCGRVTAAAFPAECRAAACYGSGVRALVCYLLVHQHLPIDRAAQLLSEVCGASVATGTLAGVVAEAAGRLEGFVEVVREQLAAGPTAHFDETGARAGGRLA